MTDVITDDKQLTYAEKIDKLLRKAEATDSAEEAEAFTSAAQRLMIKFAISEQLLASVRGTEEADEVVEEHIFYSGIFAAALFDIGSAVAKANGCKVLISTNVRGPDGKKGTRLYAVGFKSDVERVKLLDSSLQIQAVTALGSWWRGEDTSWMGGSDKYKARREFLFGFARGLQAKLELAKKEGVKEAVHEEAERTVEDVTTVTTSTELVLRTRKERVDEWYDEKYGRTTRTVRRNYSSGGYGARSAGYAAGQSANTGTTGIGSRGAIGGR